MAGEYERMLREQGIPYQVPGQPQYHPPPIPKDVDFPAGTGRGGGGGGGVMPVGGLSNRSWVPRLSRVTAPVSTASISTSM